MTKDATTRCGARAVPVIAVMAFAALMASARAQGTDEQREACTPDALKLCSDTIPDIGKTTACMKAHRAELSPRCQAVFTPAPDASPAAADPADRPRERRATRVPSPDDDLPPPRRRRFQRPDDDFPDPYPPGFGPSGRDDAADREDVARARAVIRRLCYDDVIDPGACAVTQRALRFAR